MSNHESVIRRRLLLVLCKLAVLGLSVLLALVACVPSTNVQPTSTAPGTALPSTLTGNLTLESKTPPPVTPKSNEFGVPAFGHIYTVVMENKEYGDIVDSANAPYLNSLIAQYGLATNYSGITHPSEPNYFALFSGSTQGATSDGVYNLAGKNVADQIEAIGKTWRVFAENAPTNCFTDVSARNGADGSGSYARKHNPAISFTDISRSPERCANITDLTHFDPAAADYGLIIPNLCNDMHDCSVAVGDRFLKDIVPKILSSSAWQSDSVLFITWDEGTTSLRGGGHIPLLVISNRVPKGFHSSVVHNHYSLLRTIEDAWGLECLNQACAANNLGEFFQGER